MKVLLITHAVYIDGKDIYGPPHATSLFLNKHSIEHIFIKHSLENTGHTLVDHYKKGALKRSRRIGSFRFPSVLHYVWEFMVILKVGLQCADSDTIILAYDPLNFAAAYLLARMVHARKLVYCSADFAIKRFENRILNTIYHYLDDKAMFYSDETWSVSTRIVEFRRKKGLPDDRNRHIPNAPFFRSVNRKPFTSIDRYSIVVVSAIENTIDFNALIDALATCVKKYPLMKLHIVGSGSKIKDLKQYIKKRMLTSHVVFHGVLSHDAMFTVLVGCGVGVALYHEADTFHFRYYSDPMKIRDYLAAGLPVVVSGNSALGYEIEKKKAGIHVSLKPHEIAKAVGTIISPKANHESMRKRSLALAKANDSDTILQARFSALGLNL